MRGVAVGTRGVLTDYQTVVGAHVALELGAADVAELVGGVEEYASKRQEKTRAANLVKEAVAVLEATPESVNVIRKLGEEAAEALNLLHKRVVAKVKGVVGDLLALLESSEDVMGKLDGVGGAEVDNADRRGELKSNIMGGLRDDLKLMGGLVAGIGNSVPVGHGRGVAKLLGEVTLTLEGVRHRGPLVHDSLAATNVGDGVVMRVGSHGC